MIVRDQPAAWQLLFAMQGSIIPKIIGKILFVTVISAVVFVVDRFVFGLPHVSIAAMGIFGVALSLFLGFRNNAAYDRWWEGRKLWGGMIADIRTLGRDTVLFVPDAKARRAVLEMGAAFAHFHRGHLRKADVSLQAEHWISASQVKTLLKTPNAADSALRQMANTLATLAKDGGLSDFGQLRLSQILANLSAAQAGCERIANTPLPFVYSLLVRRTTYLYCCLLPFALIETTQLFAPLFSAIVAYVFFGLQAVTNELEMPFRNVENGLPLDAMCRIIEISVADALGDAAPEPLEPVAHVLT
ncbi:hypothetical protein HKX54_16565 [Sulfitobacter sp. M57]|uniref:bestrophin family protein n=1 Tax=unclassified Sulfitobacter TaxID=196795 RepID=UPI0023E28564|nr:MULTISPECIES: bestrophin family ion channel [unclassified Sulfitobacter]MDF3416089.1 hypothetical protein [Sulfitobacter sp. KE5]MDF3423568.1 hypothetical protein [Sulfitobacter sp. KE43]MDF3434630.1 hypothetical protein [Sulfitobacter sp. KE42]MDF3460274.1 hypothetical protein [Sulfitobacter sp. S74]MDF3464168.1 hypothetical protein [Sulfitobacter sp. Ks18]